MSKPIILYVEDNDLSREVMAWVIDDMPEYELIMFSDSVDFKTRVCALADFPTLVLLDIHVQPHNGFEMLEILRSINPKTPIVALTASVMSDEVSRLKQIGFDGAIAKPIDQDRFPYYIEQALAGKAVWSIEGLMR